MTKIAVYWFPAKTHGWGWGLPLVWQGWATLGVFFGLVLLGTVVMPPAERPGLFALYVAALSVALIAVCAARGEPTAWRWGN